MVAVPRSMGARLQGPTTQTGCVSPRCAPVYTIDKKNQDLLLYSGRQHFLEPRSWVVYLQGWSDELICVLDPARAGVALVCQIEQLPNLAYDFVVV
jgi:hypothetical protein